MTEKIGTPTMKEALESFKGTCISTIVAVPIFMAPGVHTMEDIPRILGISKESRKANIELYDKDVTLLYSDPPGIDDLVAELAYKRVTEALSS